MRLTDGDSEIILAKRSGLAIRFHEEKVRAMGRTASGVRGVRLSDEKDLVIGLVTISKEDNTVLLILSDKWYGKRSSVEDNRVTGRGGKGVKTMSITEKTGSLIAMTDVTNDDELMIINKSGITIRMEVSDLRVMGRATQGVRLIRLNEKDEISSIAKIKRIEEEETEELNEDLENTSETSEENSNSSDTDQ